MAYQITSLRNHSPVAGRRYLLDANVWIFTLEAELSDKDNPRTDPYVDFIERLKRAAGSPKIVLPAAVLSEVVNRLLRDTYFPLFVEEHKTLPYKTDKNHNYKQIYRAHDKFRVDYESLLYNIKSYSNQFELISDSFADHRVKDVFNKPTVQLDFTDWLLVSLAKKHGYTIVTDDADFLLEDVPILTMNQSLLNRSRI